MAVTTNEKNLSGENENTGKDDVKKIDNSPQVTMSADQIAALVNAAVDKRMKEAGPVVQNQSFDLAALAKAITEGNKSKLTPEMHSEYAYRSREEIDELDIMDEPKIFWSTSVLNIIVDDIKKGIIDRSPFGAIKFKAKGSKKIGTGKDASILIISEFKTHSRKEADWIEKHTKFGIEFFKSTAEIGSMDLRKTHLLSKYHTALMALQGPEVIAQMKQCGLTPTHDIDQMRYAIAKHRSDEEFAKHEESLVMKMNEQKKEELLLKS